jgi:hypothetical protein
VNANAPEELPPHMERIAMLGRKYRTTVEPWVDMSLFKEPHPNMTANSPNRYVSDVSQKQGCIAELYEFVPEQFHQPMNEHSYFGSMVSIK